MEGMKGILVQNVCEYQEQSIVEFKTMNINLNAPQSVTVSIHARAV